MIERDDKFLAQLEQRFAESYAQDVQTLSFSKEQAGYFRDFIGSVASFAQNNNILGWNHVLINEQVLGLSKKVGEQIYKAKQEGKARISLTLSISDVQVAEEVSKSKNAAIKNLMKRNSRDVNGLLKKFKAKFYLDEKKKKKPMVEEES